MQRILLQIDLKLFGSLEIQRQKNCFDLPVYYLNKIRRKKINMHILATLSKEISVVFSI